jgi:hypothetical protein
LDNPEWIAKGGKDGVVLVAGKADSSELIKRLLLPDNDEHHMPPKDRPQLSSQELEVLHWWVDQGADYRKLVKDLAKTEKVKPALAGIQQASMDGGGAAGPGGRGAAGSVEIVPEAPVGAADEKDVEALRKAGVAVMPMAQGSNYLSVNFSGLPAGANGQTTGLVSLLLPLKKQLVRLDLSGSGVGDSSMEMIKQCVALRVVDLRDTKITDKAMAVLAALPELRVLNLMGTGVTGLGLLAVQPPKHLHALYLYHTKVEGKDWAKLTALYKTTVLDSGGYTLPVLTTDTAIVRPNIKK